MNAQSSNPFEYRLQKSVDQHVGMRLRLYRMEQRWSQSQLADQIGVSYQQIQKYEAGNNRIGAARLWQLSQIFKIQPNDFFDGLETSQEQSGKEKPNWFELMNRQNHNLIKRFASIEDPLARSAIITLCESLSSKS